MVVPDLILITHPHGDHFSPSILREYVNLNPNVTLAGPSDVVKMLSEKGIKATELKPNENYTIADVEFSTVPAYFKKREWNHHVEKEWLGYILQIDGESYYVTGDTESFPEMEDIKVDVIFPLLYGCGINMDLTLDMIEKTQAHFVVPVHHSNKVETINKLMDKIQEDVQCYYFLDQNLIKGQ